MGMSKSCFKGSNDRCAPAKKRQGERVKKQLEVWIKFPEGKHQRSPDSATTAEIQKGKARNKINGWQKKVRTHLSSQNKNRTELPESHSKQEIWCRQTKRWWTMIEEMAEAFRKFWILESFVNIYTSPESGSKTSLSILKWMSQCLNEGNSHWDNFAKHFHIGH